MDENVEISKAGNEQKATLTTDELKERHKAMGSLPFIQTRVLTGNFNGKPAGKEKVPTSTVVAAPNLKNWADEYHKDWAEGELTSVEAMGKRFKRKRWRFSGKRSKSSGKINKNQWT